MVSPKVARKPLSEFPEVEPVKSKSALQYRLEKEGRWEEADKYRWEVIEACRAEYEKTRRTHPKIAEWGWVEMEKAFPPLAEVDVVLQPSVEQATNARKTAEEYVEEAKEAGGEVDGDIPGLTKIPRGWGEIPVEGSTEGDVKWVHANRLCVVKKNSRGGFVVDLKLAINPAPSRGALSWLEFAIKNPTSFMKDVMAKASRGEVDEEEVEMERRERKSIAEIRALLEQMREKKG